MRAEGLLRLLSSSKQLQHSLLVASNINLGLFLKFLREDFNHKVINVSAAHAIDVGSEHLHVVLDVCDNRNSIASVAHVNKHDIGRLRSMEQTLGRLVDTITQRDSSGLVDNLQAVTLSNITSVHIGTSLKVSVPVWHRKNGIRDLNTIIIAFNDLVGLLNQHRQEVLGQNINRFVIVHHSNADATVRHLGSLEVAPLQLILHIRLVILTTNKKLHLRNGISDIGTGQCSTRISNKSLLTLHRNKTRRLAITRLVQNNINATLASLRNQHAQGTKINTANCHNCKLL